LKITVFGLSVSSSWGNGHATTYRALLRALQGRGHAIVFFEKNEEWYASNRDVPEPDFCRLELYDNWKDIVGKVRTQLCDSDVAVVGSYFPNGIEAANEVLSSAVPVKAFYDIDTPITFAGLLKGGTPYVKPDQLPEFDVYFSFTGGPLLEKLRKRFGVRKTIPFYCSFDPEGYQPRAGGSRYRCDLSYMGTYASDRQAKLDLLLRQTAISMPKRTFQIAGSQYPDSFRLPRNVRHIMHVAPHSHAEFYSSSKLTLNLTRREMVSAGFSPSVRLFEAAACGATIVSDPWVGLETFFVPGKEILIAQNSQEMQDYLETSPDELIEIGLAARERVLREHHPSHRVEQFERAVESIRGSVPHSIHPVSSVNQDLSSV
jgi:spore maturation protein CgeB